MTKPLDSTFCTTLASAESENIISNASDTLLWTYRRQLVLSRCCTLYKIISALPDRTILEAWHPFCPPP